MQNSKYYFFVLLTIIIGTFLRFFMLTEKSLWFDEGYSLYYSDGLSIQEIISRLINAKSGDRFQALYYLVLFYWRQAFGDTEFAVRSLSAFLGVGALIILFYTASQVYGKKHALWSTLLLSISSYGVYYSQQTRPYALLLFLALLQLYFFTKALNEEEIGDDLFSRLPFWIVTAFSLFASTFIGLFTTALSLSHILVYRNPKRWLKWWIPAVIFCIPAVLFYLSSPVATDPTKVKVTPSRQSIIQNVFFVVYSLLVGESYGPPIESLRGKDRIQILFNYWPQLLIFLIVGVILFLFLLLLIRFHKQPERQDYKRADYFFASLFISSFLIAFLFAVATKFNWLPRHSFYIYVPLLLLTPSILVGKRNKNRRGVRGIFRYAQIVIVALIILNIYSISNYYFNENYQRENYRSAAQYLLANQSSSVKTVLLYGSPRLLQYYGDTTTLDATELRRPNFAEKISNLVNNAETVIIAINYESLWESWSQTSVERAMSDLYTLQSKLSFTNFNMYHYMRKR